MIKIFIGLAGLCLLQERYVEAALFYRESLSVVEENEGNGASKLQKIHALHNLKELLDSKKKGVECRVSDANLEKDAKNLESEYYNEISEMV